MFIKLSKTQKGVVILISMTMLVGCLISEKASNTSSTFEKDNKKQAELRLDYPKSKRVEQVDNYHGVLVADPYRWLETDLRESQEVASWIAAQNKVTQRYLGSLPERDKIKNRLTRLWNFEKYSLPIKRGGHYFMRINSGLQNHSPIYMLDSIDSKPSLVLDPNEWSENGTVALAEWTVSPEGNYIAYSVQDSGSDWRDGYIWDVNSGEVLRDRIIGLKYGFQVEWSKDEAGVYYGRYPIEEQSRDLQSLNHNYKVYYHKLGTDQREDRLIYERPEQPDLNFSLKLTDDGRYLFVFCAKGADRRYQVVYFDLQTEGSAPVTLIETFDADWRVIHNQGSKIWFVTNKDAPLGRLIEIDLQSPGKEKWIERIPEEDLYLRDVSVVGDYIVAQYLEDALALVKLFDIDGKPQGKIELPGIGTVKGFDGAAEDPETFFSFTSYNHPKTIYRYDVRSKESAIWKSPTLVYNPDDYHVKQVFYDSKDGTKIPMVITYKKEASLPGKNPTLLYGYGGFKSLSATPHFKVDHMGWLEMGGILAVANLRGGGEYGEEWHQAGTKSKMQNVFDDFIAAAEYLINKQYTSPAHLAIHGASNGGLLVGATVNQRPELFAAAVPAVGVMDMLRFHKFTAGRFWTDEYGTSEHPDEFKSLYAYSPYHNVKNDVDYPPILVLTADTDDRVVPAHSFKYVAALQHEYSGNHPVLIRIETGAGHGAGKPTSMVVEEAADKLAFIGEHTGLTK